MNEKNAFQIITQALQIANKAGSFNLQDSAQVFAALSVLDRIHGERPEEPADPSKAKGEVVQMKAVKEAKAKAPKK